MGLFGGKAKDFRSAEEKKIEKNACNPLSPRYEGYAEELLSAFEQKAFGKFTEGQRNLNWLDVDIEKTMETGTLREKAALLGTSKDKLQKIYYRVIYLANERGIVVEGRRISVLFDGIAGWMD